MNWLLRLKANELALSDAKCGYLQSLSMHLFLFSIRLNMYIIHDHDGTLSPENIAIAAILYIDLLGALIDLAQECPEYFLRQAGRLVNGLNLALDLRDSRLLIFFVEAL